MNIFIPLIHHIISEVSMLIGAGMSREDEVIEREREEKYLEQIRKDQERYQAAANETEAPEPIKKSNGGLHLPRKKRKGEKTTLLDDEDFP